MGIEELALGTRAYGVLKGAGIETVEDLCLFTPDQLLSLGNFGQKSLTEVTDALKQRSLSLHTGPADPRLLVPFLGAGARLNLGFSVSNRDREGLARYTVRELARIQKSLVQVASQLTRRTRSRLLILNGQIGMLRSVHETILGASSGEVASVRQSRATGLD